MCGIFGYIGNKSGNLDLKKIMDKIDHRGPDSEGFLQFYPKRDKFLKSPKITDNEYKIAFGFKRLSIIDIGNHSDQPFSDENENYHIIFNGEIYNYIEIRKDLISKGFSFSTKSDTEVLLKSYMHWGVKCFSKFNGMWACLILDKVKNKLIISRDRFGIKPLYYHRSNDGYYFASEIKQFFEAGILKDINENVIKDFLEKNIIDSDNQTFFSKIFHFPKSCFAEIDIVETESTKFITHKYWNLEKNESFSKLSYEAAKIKFYDLFKQSVKLRFRSDVKIGSCLSGGLDSSSIVSVAATIYKNKINSFTSKFDIPKYDETLYVNEIVKKFTNVIPKFCQLNEKTFLNQFEKVLHHQDEPFGSMSILAQWEVMKLANKNNVKVLLDGQGGDELLAGYRKFYFFYLKELLMNFKFIEFFREVFNLLNNKDFNFFDTNQIYRYLGLNKNSNFYSKVGEKLKSNSKIGVFSANSLDERAKLDIEYYSYPPLLRFEDRNSMAFSIETRVPFMDFKVVEFLYSIPSSYKIRNGFTKYILRDALDKILPEKIQKRKSKLGFSTPQDKWMQSELFDYFKNYFKNMKNPYLDSIQIFNEFEKISNESYDSDIFFRIFCFDKWYQKNFNK